MTRYLLDTSILSNATKPRPSGALTAWMAEQDDADLYISTFTVAEIRKGIHLLEEGRRKRDLEAWFSGPGGPQKLFAGRVLAFDESSALAWAQVMADGKKSGLARSPLDMMIAAVAIANACTVVTDNDRHFAGVTAVINPMRA